MKVSGEARLPAPPEAVREALADAGLLVSAVPWLDRLDPGGDGRYRFLATTTIAAVSGAYAGEAAVTAEPGALTLRISAAGARGTVTADVTVELGPAGADATDLGFAVDAAVEGAVAGIGQLMLAGIAKRLAADAIAGIGAALASPPEPGPPEPGPLAAAEPAASESDASDTAGGAVIERAGRGIWLVRERHLGSGETVVSVGPGALAGAAAGAAAIVLGVILVRRRRGGR
jgi:uncharacterized protein